jgi:hypothetical protein
MVARAWARPRVIAYKLAPRTRAPCEPAAQLVRFGDTVRSRSLELSRNGRELRVGW